MSKQQFQNDPLEFAKKYSELDLAGYKAFQFENVPILIKQHVKGNFALDYGCGTGLSTLLLKLLGFNVEGVDINQLLIEIAQQRDPPGIYELIQSGKIPREDNYYDLVYCCYVLVYIDTKEELLNVCQDISRVLKKGGICIAVVDHKSKFQFNHWQMVTVGFEENIRLTSGCVTKTLFTDNKYVVYTWYWTDEDYYEAFTKSGFQVIRLLQPSDNDTSRAIFSETIRNFSRIYVVQKL